MGRGWRSKNVEFRYSSEVHLTINGPFYTDRLPHWEWTCEPCAIWTLLEWFHLKLKCRPYHNITRTVYIATAAHLKLTTTQNSLVQQQQQLQHGYVGRSTKWFRCMETGEQICKQFTWMLWFRGQSTVLVLVSFFNHTKAARNILSIKVMAIFWHLRFLWA